MSNLFHWLLSGIYYIFSCFYNFFMYIWGIFLDIVYIFTDFIFGIWITTYNSVQYGVYYVFDTILSILYNLVDYVGEYFQIGQISSNRDVWGFSFNEFYQAFAEITDLFQWVNLFIPLDTMFFCLIVYSEILVSWIVYKLVKSWIPTVSGS